MWMIERKDRPRLFPKSLFKEIVGYFILERRNVKSFNDIQKANTSKKLLINDSLLMYHHLNLLENASQIPSYLELSFLEP
jgi:hypothetical protein